MSGFVFVLNTHYMWFIEGQDLAAEQLSHHFSVMGKVESASWWIPGIRNNDVG